ncbi:hypothetical protein ABH37_19185 [Mycobacterium haemophilum]|uniref:PAS domain-containing protein n=1 Tax=Mycobacterium haemophilum TaxID=29311 RepID=A0A0I9UUC2_9MYCO|nr:hypothetical protein ABH39_16265 [Mycobacterium haemophilum]KLO37312.1 hypothetical protein ABH37_19185 [Mycobacterium haemophilum]KLO38671.1 hypothetical protein ABH38_02680 [Mycobacterium haemophilum]KLO45245.1 hypothetical protein ABH36_19095 [Mycobacterium haemophilum]
MERRRCQQADRSPAAVLRQLPATVVLDRLPIPVLGIGPNGSVEFANAALCAMLGYCPEAIQKLRREQIFRSGRADQSAFEFLRARGDQLVTLTHAQGYDVRARMSKSALLRHDDAIVLVTFSELTDLLWCHDQQ